MKPSTWSKRPTRISTVEAAVIRLSLAAVVAAGLTVPATAQHRDHCEDTARWNDRDSEHHCEIREYSLTNIREIVVDGGQNGGITVTAWDRDQILVEAVVQTRARSVERARELAGQVEVSANSPHVTARGPSSLRRESWWVSWHIYAPPGTDLNLEVLNGGIRIAGMTGTTRFVATNGGVRLTDMAGDVSGSTTNGGLHIELSGNRWTGVGMDVSATNGGVQLSVPEDYAGEFETGTVNGRLDLDFPITVQGRFGGRELRFTLGEGGPRIRAVTTNGGVRVRRT